MGKIQLILTVIACVYGTTQAETIKVAVASASEVKTSAVYDAFDTHFKDSNIEVAPYRCPSGVPEQPIGIEVAIKGARNRISQIPEDIQVQSDYIVSIENTIEYIPEKKSWKDIGVVIMKKNHQQGKEVVTYSRATAIPMEFVHKAEESSKGEEVLDEGYSMTIGNVIKEAFPLRDIQADDWHREIEFGGVSRKNLLQEAVFKALHFEEISALRERIVHYQGFPKPDIVFADFFPLVQDGASFSRCVDLFAEYYRGELIDVVVGLESRGFIFGAAIAMKLGVGFVPARKPGKLPGAVHSLSYEKEYGVDTLCIPQDVFKGRKKVLLVDDLIATGGSARAAIELVRLAGGEPIGFATLLEVKGLNGRETLGVPSFNLID